MHDETPARSIDFGKFSTKMSDQEAVDRLRARSLRSDSAVPVTHYRHRCGWLTDRLTHAWVHSFFCRVP